MSTNGQLVFTDVDKITFKGVGNASNAVIDTLTGKIGVGVDSPDANLHVVGNSYVSTNLELGGTLIMGTVNVEAQHSLEAVTATGNTTPLTIEFTNPTTSLVASGNVVVTGNVTADHFVGDGSNITGISSTLQAITDSGPGANVTSNTVQFSNAITGLVTTANVEVGGELTVSGNVAVDTDTLFVDSVNDRVGIGTTTPDNTLHISGTQNQLVQIQNTSDTARLVLNGGSGTGGDLIFKQAGTTTWGIASIGDSLHFLGDDSTSQTRMTINNAGIVTTPSRPAFYAWDNSASRSGITLTFDSTTYNIGSHYNTSTSRFKTPVAGTYIFAAVIVHDTANALSAPYYSFYVDGANRRDIIEGTGSHNAHYEQHGVYIVNLNANQYVDIRSRSSTNITFINGNHGAYYRNCFQGALLG